MLFRLPELAIIILQYNDFFEHYTFYNYSSPSDNSSELFEFLFPLNGMAQFMIFYFFNRNFKDSFVNVYLQKKESKSSSLF